MMTEYEMVDWVQGIIRDYGTRDELLVAVPPEQMSPAEAGVATLELRRLTGRGWHVIIAAGAILR